MIDRTPYGVLQHEQGHAHDYHAASSHSSADRYFSDFSVRLRAASGEPRLTSYCPDDAEWYAEMHRLFVTNSDLLRLLRPRTYALIREHLRPVVDSPWTQVLAHAPDRTVAQARRKIAEVRG